jgi:PAS domain-containing protein
VEETWSYTSQLRTFENGALEKIFGYKRDEVREGWRRLHNEELYDLYCSPSTISVTKSRIMKQAEAFGKYGGQGMCLQGFDGKT